MRYVKKTDLRAARINTNTGNISVTGSVRGMQMRYPNDWKPGGQIRIGAWVYNVGPAEVSRLRSQGFLRGER